MPTVELSTLDRAIIAILQREGRTTYAQIGARVGVSATAAHERIKKLEARGVITGYHAGIDPALRGSGRDRVHLRLPKGRPRGELEDAVCRPAVGRGVPSGGR